MSKHANVQAMSKHANVQAMSKHAYVMYRQRKGTLFLCQLSVTEIHSLVLFWDTIVYAHIWHFSVCLKLCVPSYTIIYYSAYCNK